MGNCLKTQLKEVVNNDNLSKFNELLIHCSSVEDTSNVNYNYFYLGVKEPVTITVVGNGYFVFDGEDITDPSKQRTTYTGPSAVFRLANGNYKLAISNKYVVSVLNTNLNSGGERVAKVNFNDLSYILGMTNLGMIAINSENWKIIKNLSLLSIFMSANTYGDVADLPGQDFTNLIINGGTSITGDFAELGTKLSSVNAKCYFNGTSITGNIESFVDNARNKDVTTANYYLYGLSQIYFGGSLIQSSYGNRLYFDSSKICVYNGNTLEDSTVICAKGATQAEIDAWKQAGKTVVVVS